MVIVGIGINGDSTLIEVEKSLMTFLLVFFCNSSILSFPRTLIM